MNRVPSLEYISVSRDAHEFLKHALFGAWDSIYIAASERAYRDMCRTLRLTDVDGKKLRDEIARKLEEETRTLLEKGVANQKQFDLWHLRVCKMIQEHYAVNGVELTVGQAQKWVNMMLKYLFVADAPGSADMFYFCHVPIDSYIIAAAEQQLKLKRPAMPWSKITEYDSYLAYQKELRIRLGNTAPLEWEFKTWLSTATGEKR
jgi:hypothetical protein